MDNSNPFVFPTFRTSLHPLSIMLVLEAPWITYFSLSRGVFMTTSKIVVSMDKWLGKKCFCLKCCVMGQQVGLIWWSACNLVVICRIVGWCLIMSCVFRNGPPWLVVFTIRCIAKCSPLQFMTCNMNPQKFNVSCGQNWTKWCLGLVLQTPISKGSWWIMHMPIGMLFISCMVLEMFLWRWLTRNELACSIGLSCLIDTKNNWLH
jgi:hypothetical protein